MEGGWQVGWESVGAQWGPVGAPSGEFLRLLSPGACTTWALGVWAWIWAWIWAQRGGGVFGGVLVGSLLVSWGGEGVADKEEREGRCTSIGLHLETDLTPSVVNFVRSCLVSCTGAARATREAPATKTKRTKFGVSGENIDWNCSSTNLDTKTHRPFFSRLRHAELHRNVVSTQPLKIRTAGRSVWCMI